MTSLKIGIAALMTTVVAAVLFASAGVAQAQVGTRYRCHRLCGGLTFLELARPRAIAVTLPTKPAAKPVLTMYDKTYVTGAAAFDTKTTQHKLGLAIVEDMFVKGKQKPLGTITHPQLTEYVHEDTKYTYAIDFDGNLMFAQTRQDDAWGPMAKGYDLASKHAILNKLRTEVHFAGELSKETDEDDYLVFDNNSGTFKPSMRNAAWAGELIKANFPCLRFIIKGFPPKDTADLGTPGPDGMVTVFDNRKPTGAGC